MTFLSLTARVALLTAFATPALADLGPLVTPAELAANLKTLKDIAGLYRSLSETLSASAGVGARAVALSGLTAEQGAGLALSSVSGKKPLVSLSFNVSAPAPRERQAEVLEAELVDARSEP